MAATSQLFGTWILVVAVTLNTLGWFWTHHRLDILSVRIGAPAAGAAPMRQGSHAPAVSKPAAPLPQESTTSNEMPRPSQFDVPGVVSPALKRPQEVKLDEDEKVIGIEVDGEARAYVMKAFEANGITKKEDLGVHIVNDSIANQPICVTYCDRTHSARVLTNRDESLETSPVLDVRLGGWSQGLILLFDGNRYDHHAPTIPLEDVEFVTTTWGKWVAEHPDTLVYTRD